MKNSTSPPWRPGVRFGLLIGLAIYGLMLFVLAEVNNYGLLVGIMVMPFVTLLATMIVYVGGLLRTAGGLLIATVIEGLLILVWLIAFTRGY